MKKTTRCGTCGRDPKRMNNGHNSECSHVDCPSRRSPWSAPHEHLGPYPKNIDADPIPLDFDKSAHHR